MTTSERLQQRPEMAPAERMQGFLKAQSVPYSRERSAKCRPGRWSQQRCLFSTPVEALGVERLTEALPPLLVALGMTEGNVRDFIAEMQPASAETPHYLHLGVEDGRCKVYWEATRPEQLADDERYVLYRAWKWQPGEDSAISDYVLMPSARLARQAIHEQLADMPMAMADLLEQLEVSFALRQTPWPPLAVRIEERQAQRKTLRASLNLHLHQAQLPLGSIAGLMMGLTREWQSLPRAEVVNWIASHGDEPLGNLSFGCGDDGQPFLTCYHGARLCRPEHGKPQQDRAEQGQLEQRTHNATGR